MPGVLSSLLKPRWPASSARGQRCVLPTTTLPTGLQGRSQATAFPERPSLHSSPSLLTTGHLQLFGQMLPRYQGTESSEVQWGQLHSGELRALGLWERKWGRISGFLTHDTESVGREHVHPSALKHHNASRPYYTLES